MNSPYISPIGLLSPTQQDEPLQKTEVQFTKIKKRWLQRIELEGGSIEYQNEQLKPNDLLVLIEDLQTHYDQHLLLNQQKELLDFISQGIPHGGVDKKLETALQDEAFSEFLKNIYSSAYNYWFFSAVKQGNYPLVKQFKAMPIPMNSWKVIIFEKTQKYYIHIMEDFKSSNLRTVQESLNTETCLDEFWISILLDMPPEFNSIKKDFYFAFKRVKEDPAISKDEMFQFKLESRMQQIAKALS